MKWRTGENRIDCLDTDGSTIGHIDFMEISPGVYDIYRTEVDVSHRGEGIASDLVESAVDEIKWREGKIRASCPYAAKWLERHSA